MAYYCAPRTTRLESPLAAARGRGRSHVVPLAARKKGPTAFFDVFSPLSAVVKESIEIYVYLFDSFGWHQIDDISVRVDSAL